MENRKYDVFVSYSRKDAVIVDEICQLMRQKQIVYYRDTQEIPGGEKFFDELAKSILDSVVFLYIGSKNSYTSIYTPKEINFAISKNTNVIIPYMVDDAPLPDNLFLAFSDINVRNKGEHSPEIILEDIIKGVSKDNYVVEPDRKEAIRKGLNMLKKNDVLLILGKGHEDYQIIGHTKYHLDDLEEVKKYLGLM